MQNILVVRTDRIGDVMLTLPVVEALRSNFPESRISMLVASYTSGLVDGSAEVILYNREGIETPFFEMLAGLRKARFDAAVVAYPRFRIALLLLLARIPVRIGTAYRWYSFLFNKKVYEHRKTAEKHEAEYNLSLLGPLGCRIPPRPEVHLELSEGNKRTALAARRETGASDNDRMVLLHPGSGGSAHIWSAEKFTQLASELKRKGFYVVITGSKKEEELVKNVAGEAGQGVKTFISLLGLKEFAGFIQLSDLFIANSTGPLHIAAAVGIPVIGFYPPVRVMSPERWGPLTEKKVIFVPDPKKCPRCRGGRCRGSDCMDLIEVQEVAEAAVRLISG